MRTPRGYPSEDVGPTVQDKLLVARRPATDLLPALLATLDKLERLAANGGRAQLLTALRTLVPEYQPADGGQLPIAH